jgi:hypothetical protein
MQSIELKRGFNRGGNGLRLKFRSREEDDLVLTRGSHWSARKKRKEKGKREEGLLGWFGADRAGWVPGAAQLGCAPPFFVLIHFPFSVFLFSLYLLHLLFK